MTVVLELLESYQRYSSAGSLLRYCMNQNLGQEGNILSDNLTQKAYRHIHGKLSGGELVPGSRLSNRGVAKEVGVSFTPVREALNRLVSEGLLEYRQGLGVFVPMLNTQEIREIYELREILESEAASRVCENDTSIMTAEMTSAYDVMVDIFEKIQSEGHMTGEHADTWQVADSEFHMSLLRAAGNRRLLDTVEGLRTSLKAMMGGLGQMTGIVGHRFDSEPLAQIKRTVDEHRRILEALKKGDGADARTVMIEHIRSGLELALAAHKRNHMGPKNSFLHTPHNH